MVVDMKYWTRVLKRIAFIVASLLLLFLSFKLAVFYVPFLIAWIISLIIEPVIKFLSKKTKLTRKTSAVIVLLIFFAILISLITWLVVSIITESSRTIATPKYIYFKRI